MYYRWFFLVIFFLNLFFDYAHLLDCSKSECLKIADPLIRETRFIFPDNMADIQLGCRTWDEFVNCLKHYTEQCFNEDDRRKFNNAVESPIENIHELCMNNNYQNEYLKFASCIKNTITERNHCGSEYQMLVDQVSQRDNLITKSMLCCSHNRFKNCVKRETRRLCDDGRNNGQASRFSMQLLDKALRFIEDQCVNYIPTSSDCNMDSLPSTDILSMSTVPSEIYPWSTLQENKEARNPTFSRSSTLNVVTPTYSWMSSSSSQPPPIFSASPSTSPEILGSRTRPASYGRAGGSWTSETNQISPSSSTKQPYNPGTARPYWATTSNFDVAMKKEIPELGNSLRNDHVNVGSFHTTEETTHWYPAAGSYLSNDVEEPNQQGLTIQKNDGNLMSYSFHSIFLAMLLMILM